VNHELSWTSIWRGAVYFANFCVQEDGHASGAAFFFQHRENIAGGTVAE